MFCSEKMPILCDRDHDRMVIECTSTYAISA